MADTPARRSALAEIYHVGRCGTQSAHPDIVLRERRDLTMIDLRGNPQHAEFLASAQAALGCALPLAPNTSVMSQDCNALWLGPDQWLLVGSRASETLPIVGGFLTDVSHGRAAVRLSGARGRELLAKGCGLDLHPRMFHAGECAQTSIARVTVLLHLHHTDGEFDLYFARSYAVHLWHWLTDAAAEFGCEVAPGLT